MSNNLSTKNLVSSKSHVRDLILGSEIKDRIEKINNSSQNYDGEFESIKIQNALDLEEQIITFNTEFQFQANINIIETQVNDLIQKTLKIFEICKVNFKGNKADLKEFQQVKKELSSLANYANNLLNLKDNDETSLAIKFQGQKLATYLVTLGIEIPEDAKHVQKIKVNYEAFLQITKQEFIKENPNSIVIADSLKTFLVRENLIDIPELVKNYQKTYKQALDNKQLPDQFSNLADKKGLAIGASLACGVNGAILFPSINMKNSLKSYGFLGAIGAVAIDATNMILPKLATCLSLAAGVASLITNFIGTSKNSLPLGGTSKNSLLQVKQLDTELGINIANKSFPIKFNSFKAKPLKKFIPESFSQGFEDMFKPATNQQPFPTSGSYAIHQITEQKFSLPKATTVQRG